MIAGYKPKIVAMDSANMWDRVQLCWGHIENWRESRSAKNIREWLERSNGVFRPTTFIAYVEENPAGVIEFLPQRLLKQLRLSPCRLDVERGETEERYNLGEGFDDYLFISCLYVNKDYQGRGVGRALLNHFLNSEVFMQSEGAAVYVAERDESWESYIHWPAGPKEFYVKTGFVIEKTLKNPSGYLLSYANPKQAKLGK